MKRKAKREGAQRKCSTQNSEYHGCASTSATEKFSVVLTDFGANKPSVFKELQKLCGASSYEIKRAFKLLPEIVMLSVPKNEAERCKFQLEKVGAAIEILDGRISESQVRDWTKSVRGSRSWMEKLRNWMTNREAVYIITVSVVLLGGTYVLAKLLVWWLLK